MLIKCDPDNALSLKAIPKEVLNTLGRNPIEVIEDRENNRLILIFNNEYKKTNVDIVISEGEWFISSEYGEEMKREDIDYVREEKVRSYRFL